MNRPSGGYRRSAGGHVAAVDRARDLATLEVGDHPSERRQVAVDVGDDRERHERPSDGKFFRAQMFFFDTAAVLQFWDAAAVPQFGAAP